MREYEACFVIHPKVDEAGIEREIGAFSETVTSNQGKMVGVHKWGRRKLAYPVQKVRDGFYVLARFNGEADVLAEVDRRFKLNDNILRHLVVRSLGDAFPPDLRAREPRRGMRGEAGPGRGRRRDDDEGRPEGADRNAGSEFDEDEDTNGTGAADGDAAPAAPVAEAAAAAPPPAEAGAEPTEEKTE